MVFDFKINDVKEINKQIDLEKETNLIVRKQTMIN